MAKKPVVVSWEDHIDEKREEIETRIGLGQARILVAIEACGRNAYGLAIEQHVRAQGGKPMSEPQVYVSLKRLAARFLIEIVEKRKVPNTPPIIIYKLTKRGKDALTRKLAELGPLAAAVLSRP